MFNFSPYLRTTDGEHQTKLVTVKSEEENGVFTIYFNGFTNATLDMEFGAGIDFDINNITAWSANYRSCEFWCNQAFGTDLKDVPDETQGLIYKLSDNTYGVIMPLVSEKYKCVLCGNENGGLTARIFSWYQGLSSCNAPVFVCAEGENPYVLLESCVKHGLEILNNGCLTRQQRRYPEIFEYLGWCSWDALQIRVNEQGLLDKCEEFKEKNIPVKWLIIDDMWEYVEKFVGVQYKDMAEMMYLMHAASLSSFEADYIRFPNGLKGCIDKIKKYGLKTGIWHPTTGYWYGIDPDGEVYNDTKDLLFQEDGGRYLHRWEKDKAYLYYSKQHDFLQKCGADFVKIDNQSITRRYYKGKAPVGIAAKSFHDAMEASVGQHFDNCMINCMGMASEDMWNRSQSPLSRCSNDFMPESREWFSRHIIQCTFNSLFQGQFYYNDYDMWWTNDTQAKKNSLLRAVSGGPVYISDKIGCTQVEVLMPLILSDGRILRCDRPGMPTKDCMFDSPEYSKQIFKIQNICNDGGVIAVFNIDKGNNAVSGKISPSEIDGLKGERFAVYNYFTKSLTILNFNESINLTLNNNDEVALYTIVPLKNGFAPIGRTDKFISLKTIKSVCGGKLELFETGPYAYVYDEKLIIKD